MNQFIRLIVIATIGMSLVSSGMSLPGLPAGPGFGTPKTKVYLQRKLPALVRLNGGTFRVKVSGRENQVDLSRDLGAQLETEMMKDDPHFRADEMNPSILISCQDRKRVM